VATERERARCRERLERLGASTQDCLSIQQEAIADLRRVLGFDRWCWPFADPDTLVPLSGVAEHDYGPRLRRALELEFSGADFAAKHVLARRADGAGSLSAETGGDLARSPRWDEVMRPVGIGDLAAAACRDARGCWGWIEVYRDGGDRRFRREELELLASAGRSLGAALRRGAVAGATAGPVDPPSPGVVVLDADLRLVTWTARAREWIGLLPAAQLFATWNMLPAVLYPVATLARTPVGHGGAHALERGVDGGWVMIEAASLKGDDHGRVAVTLREATVRETFDVLCRGYALTSRERAVVAAVLAGLDTRAICARLFISPHTVQDHLKSVFAKVGVQSRRELRTTFGPAGGVAV
jgi:DNA-binding CsgD family transcriptional regulator